MTITARTPRLTTTDDWPTLRALAAATAQQIFRACLEALSRPGTISRLPYACVPEPVPAVVAPLLAFTDLMAPLYGLDSPEVPGARRAAELVGQVTGARVSEPSRARFALAFAESAEMTDLAVGTHWSPEFGALLCQRVTDLREPAAPNGQPALRLRLRGPGVNGSRELAIGGLSTRFVALRDALTADFPTGVDVLLVTDGGEIAGLPRTTRIEVL